MLNFIITYINSKETKSGQVYERAVFKVKADDPYKAWRIWRKDVLGDVMGMRVER